MADATPENAVLARVDVLDGVRGLAVLMVLLYHSGQPDLGGLLLQSGVDLFFVLSGFLITSILLRTREHAGYLRLFYARRAVRIFPLYYLVLNAFLIGAWVMVRYGVEDRFGFPMAQNLLDNRWWGWLYQVNNLEAFRGESAFAGLGHLWSLAIEEQFYLLWPLLVLRAPRRRLLQICLGIAALSLTVRCVGYPLLGRDFAYYFTLSRFDGLALGAAGAVVVASPELTERFRPAVAWVGRHWWVVALLVLMPEQAALYAGFTVLSIGYLGFVLAAHDGVLADRPTRWLRSRLLNELGRYSYAIYIFSVPIAQAFDPPGLTRIPLLGAAVQIVVVGCLSYGLARLSWVLWEAPWLRLKQRLTYV